MEVLYTIQTYKHTHIRYLASHIIKQTHTINHLGTKIMCVLRVCMMLCYGLRDERERQGEGGEGGLYYRGRALQSKPIYTRYPGSN